MHKTPKTLWNEPGHTISLLWCHQCNVEHQLYTWNSVSCLLWLWREISKVWIWEVILIIGWDSANIPLWNSQLFLTFVIFGILSSDKHIKSMVQSCFLHLRNIFLSAKQKETVLDAFFSCRLDYCKSLLSGICQKSLSCLQLIRNSAVSFEF